MNAASGKRILIVEDESDVADLLALHLKKTGEFSVSIAADGAAGLEQARSQKPSLVVLDLMLPKMSGLDVCKILRRDPETRAIPVLMLTAKADEIDRIAGLEFGADDYVIKPFSPREVILRIKAILRRSAIDGEGAVVTAGPIMIDPVRHEVRVGENTIHLTSIEFRLLQTLVERRGRVQGRDRLLYDVWGYETMIDTRTVDTHVRRLREKLGEAGEIIETVRGFGYKLRED